jgi:hypothetical protein
MSRERSVIKFYSTVKKVEHKRRILRGWKDVNDKEQFEYEDMGWYLLLDGSWEYLHVGKDRPDFEVGQRVEVTIKVV